MIWFQLVTLVAQLVCLFVVIWCALGARRYRRESEESARLARAAYERVKVAEKQLATIRGQQR